MRDALLVAERAIRNDFVPEGLDLSEDDDKTRLALDLHPSSAPRVPVKPPAATLALPTLRGPLSARASPAAVQALAFAAGGVGAGIVLAVIVYLMRSQEAPHPAARAAFDAGHPTAPVSSPR